jgi:glycosyltransferase involved in cell wall biosynthesis
VPDPVATLIVPTRNAGLHLRATLDSLLEQTRGDFLLLLVDDASTDGTPELAGSVAAGRVEIHRNPLPLGIPGNWNHGAGLVRTRLFGFAHQDDVYAPNWFERMVAALEQAPEAAFAHCQSGTIDADGRSELGPAERYKLRFWNGLPAVGRHEHFARLCAGNFIACPSVLLRTAPFRTATGFRADLRFAADWEMWLRLLLAGHSACAVAEQLVDYRRHAASATPVAAANLSRYQEELQVAEWARLQGIAEGLLPAAAPPSRALRNNVLVDALADLEAGARDNAERKLAFLREHAPWLWRDPSVRAFRALRRCGPPGLGLLRLLRSAAIRLGPGIRG